MKEEVVIVERAGRVGVITLNGPKVLNALNDELMDALGAALLASTPMDDAASCKDPFLLGSGVDGAEKNA